MFKVGITGGIGSGKSFICKMFFSLNVPVYNSDRMSKELIETNEVIKSNIKKEFGNDSYDESGSYDRKKMSSKVFNDKKALEKLNAIVHPEVFKHFNQWIIQQHGAPYVIMETAILFESGANKYIDNTITVCASEEIRIQRVIDRDKKTKEEVLSVLKTQMSDDDRMKLSDFIIFNSGNDSVISQVTYIHNHFLNIAKSGQY